MQPIRVLHIVTYMGRGGLETMLMNYYRHIDRTKVQFDFLVHRDFEFSCLKSGEGVWSTGTDCAQPQQQSGQESKVSD